MRGPARPVYDLTILQTGQFKFKLLLTVVAPSFWLRNIKWIMRNGRGGMGHKHEAEMIPSGLTLYLDNVFKKLFGYANEY